MWATTPTRWRRVFIMHLHPEWVLPLSQAGEGIENKHKIKAFSQGWMWAERRWRQVTEDTGIGNPCLATAEKGKRYFEYITHQIAETLLELQDLDTGKAYG